MIHFKCPNCGQEYDCEDEFLGQNVQCAICNSFFHVAINLEAPSPQVSNVENQEPAVQEPVNTQPQEEPSDSNKIIIDFGDCFGSEETNKPAAPAAPRKISPRQRRLMADQKMMYEYFSNFQYIKVAGSVGTPPEKYYVDYFVRGVERIVGKNIVYRNQHRVEIVLPGTYPRTPPTCRMLTPIFHPNIEPAVICIGDHWTAGERLCDLVVRIGEIITYQSYNIKSPLDGEAAMWADLNENFLPIDNCDLMPPEM